MTQLLEQRLAEIIEAIAANMATNADAQFLLQMLIAQRYKIDELEAELEIERQESDIAHELLRESELRK
jgi:hypothetical protein